MSRVLLVGITNPYSGMHFPLMVWEEDGANVEVDALMISDECERMGLPFLSFRLQREGQKEKRWDRAEFTKLCEEKKELVAEDLSKLLPRWEWHEIKPSRFRKRVYEFIFLDTALKRKFISPWYTPSSRRGKQRVAFATRFNGA